MAKVVTTLTLVLVVALFAPDLPSAPLPAGGVVAASASSEERFASFSFGRAAAHEVMELVGTGTDLDDAIHPPTSNVPSITTEYRTPNGWLLRPAGRQDDTQRAPTGVAVSPDHKTVFVVTSGIFNEHLHAFDAETGTETQTQVGSLYMGVAADDQNNLWASGGYRNKVYQFKYEGPVAGGVRQVGPAPGSPDEGIEVIGYPGNMTLGPDHRLYVVGNLSIPYEEEIKNFDAKATPCDQSRVCSVVNIIDESDPNNVTPPVHVVGVGRDAFGVVLHDKANKLYVTNWGDGSNPLRANGRGTLSVLDVAKPGAEREIKVIPVGHHPTGIAISPDRKRLAVANSADDTVTIFKLKSNGMPGKRRTISVKTNRGAPRAATPLSVAFGPKNDRLFIGLAGQNAVMMRTYDGDRVPRTVKVGAGENGTTLRVPNTYIPTGWYPSAMAVGVHPSVKERRLYVTNLKGIGAGPGVNGQAEPFVGSRTQGTLSSISLAFGKRGKKHDTLDQYTATVVENNRWVSLFDKASRDAAGNPCLPAPLPSGKKVRSDLLCKAFKGKIDARRLHVIYMVKENKTFDQFFGDIKPFLTDADADPTWLLYGNDVTTNQHNLAKTFSLNDNFWADSEQSTTGHSWTSAGYATEFNEITWNPEYSESLRGNRWGGQYSGQTSGPTDEEVAETEGELFEPEERLVDLFAGKTNRSGATFRIYSDDVEEESEAADWQVPLGFWGIGDSQVAHGRDLDFPDTDRARIYLHGKTVSHAWSGDQGGPPPTYGQEIALSPADQQKFSFDAWSKDYDGCIKDGGSDAKCQRAMPNFIYMALPVDHTLGFNPETPTPASMVADNDKAVGMVVDALSKSPFWKTSLVMITEDDTQAAGDHVDAHRTFLLTAGGLSTTQGSKGQAAHQAASYPSILKTVEVLFRLPPLTIYDRGAVPLHEIVVNSFDDANSIKYDGVEPPTEFAWNPSEGDLAELSESMDWRLDMTNPYMLRDLLYHGIKGWPLPDRYDRILARLRRDG